MTGSETPSAEATPTSATRKGTYDQKVCHTRFVKSPLLLELAHCICTQSRLNAYTGYDTVSNLI